MADLETDRLRLHVQHLGQGGNVVVFVHGLVMDNLSSWYFTVANKVAQHNRVLLYDLRGHGRSERPAEGYSTSSMVADLAALLDAAGIDEPVWIVGNSFGGTIGLMFALAWPERTAGLVLVDAHLNDDGFADRMTATLGLQGAQRDHMIAESFKHWLGRHSERKRTRLADNAKALVYETSLMDDLRRSPPVDVHELARLQLPILALYGETSDILQNGKQLAERLPNCELKIFPGCSHSILWEETALLRDTISHWLECHC
jgi:pimeloyl-ACP methyl ester carboxylesterase